MQAITKNIEWQFSDKEVTAWGGMRMFKEFYDRTGIREELKRMALPEPGSNAGFDPVVVMESFWMSVWIGGSRFAHTTVVSCQTVSLGPFVVMSDRFSRAICHCLTCARSVPASVNRFKRPEGQSSTGMPVGEWPFRPKGVEQGSKDQNSQGATGIARGGPTSVNRDTLHNRCFASIFREKSFYCKALRVRSLEGVSPYSGTRS